MIAQKNMMMKQSKAYYQEIFDVLKNLSEGGKGNEKFMEKINGLMQGKKIPKHVMTIYNENMKRLMSLGGESSELTNLKGYLEWIASLPYGVNFQPFFILNFNLLNSKLGQF
jgi:ATP-dependent Lon protease